MEERLLHPVISIGMILIGVMATVPMVYLAYHARHWTGWMMASIPVTLAVMGVNTFKTWLKTKRSHDV
ncbi:MAG: hypothetical protein AAF800_08695 [Planctomycetota bacterium]